MQPQRLALVVAVVSLCVGACAPATPAPTATPDPCSPQNTGPTIKAMHELTREFDDASTLAANTDLRNLYTPISDLQRIRRAAEDQVAPTCLQKLSGAQLAYMNKVVDTLVAFSSGNADVNALGQGLQDARSMRDQYNLELAAAMGVPVPMPSPSAPVPATP